MGEKICMILNGAPEKEMTMIDMLIQLDVSLKFMNNSLCQILLKSLIDHVLFCLEIVSSPLYEEYSLMRLIVLKCTCKKEN